MKRHPSLAHLSREHHGALILARLLQKNAPVYKSLPEDTNGKSEYALKFYKLELVKHFKEEEKVLKFVTGINPTLDALVDSILSEHLELHGLFSLIPDHIDIVEHLDEVGKALEVHIRKEERVVFPMIEESCSESVLKTIGTSLTSKL